MLRADVEAMHQVLLENHPGAVDRENEFFRNWLEKGYEQALVRARTCRSFEGYRFAFQAYAHGFKDGHLWIQELIQRRNSRWPGFVVGKRSGKLVVVSVEGNAATETMPTPGAELIACDGVSPRGLIAEGRL